MSRVREHLRHTALYLALATCLAAGCIFSPDQGFTPPTPPPPIDSEEALIDALSRAYLTRDSDLFKSLLANDPDRNAEYFFILSEPAEITGETQWGYTEEARIHQRMFHPEAPPPGDPEVASDLWLQAMTITLTKQEPFAVREDLYSVDHGDDGKLDPDIWRVTDARYSTYVFFDLVGTDYKVEGEANFVVIEDLTKVVGDPGKFLIYIWEDISTTAKPANAGPAL